MHEIFRKARTTCVSAGADVAIRPGHTAAETLNFSWREHGFVVHILEGR
jgi:hypothetical protein